MNPVSADDGKVTLPSMQPDINSNTPSTTGRETAERHQGSRGHYPTDR